MQLNLDRMGRITAEFPATFYRVENWNTGRRVADFTTKAEAEEFAIVNARETGCKYDHKVSTVKLSGK